MTIAQLIHVCRAEEPCDQESLLISSAMTQIPLALSFSTAVCFVPTTTLLAEMVLCKKLHYFLRWMFFLAHHVDDDDDHDGDAPF